ncbi:MAG: hypothetical protein LBH18_05935 [Spirochaetaceae bacterium]|nr:hypothetical protein [Spirochaetaceae bacterium]
MFLTKTRRAAVFLFAALTLCASCSTRLSGEIYSDGRAKLVLDSALLPAMSGLLKNFAARGGNDSAVILDAGVLNKAFTLMTGIESSELRNVAGNRVEGTIVISNIGLFLNNSAGGLAAPDAAKQPEFAVWERKPSGGGAFNITINRDTGRQFLSLLAPELVDYLSALMAPVVTGEVINKVGYLELVSAVYGKAVADDLAAAELSIAVSFPGPVESVAGGTFRGSQTEFKMPLLDLLVLDTPVIYDVRWTPWR